MRQRTNQRAVNLDRQYQELAIWFCFDATLPPKNGRNKGDEFNSPRGRESRGRQSNERADKSADKARSRSPRGKGGALNGRRGDLAKTKNKKKLGNDLSTVKKKKPGKGPKNLRETARGNSVQVGCVVKKERWLGIHRKTSSHKDGTRRNDCGRDGGMKARRKRRNGKRKQKRETSFRVGGRVSRMEKKISVSETNF